MRSPPRALLIALTLGGLLVALSPRARGDELREDVFMCEDAVARVQSCCPAVDVARFRCVYSVGCGSTTTPEFSTDAARCIVHSSCDALNSGLVCGLTERLCP